MSLDDRHIGALIDGIYEAALSPDRWSSVLMNIGQTIGSTNGSALWFDGKGTSVLRAATWDVDPDATAAYEQHYIKICPRLRLSRMFGAGDSYDDRNVRAHPGQTDREYYDFMDSYDCGLARTVLGERNPRLRMGLNFYGPIRDDEAGTEHRLLQALAPHVRRAAHLTLTIADAKKHAEFGEDLFEMSSAMLLVDDSGRVQRMNLRAETALALKDGLSVVQGQLQAGKPAEDARLRREIAAALEPGRAPPPDCFVSISRPSGRPAWAVSAVPLPWRHRHDKTPKPSQALITLAQTVPHVSPARLQRGFGLSQAEAEIAAALAGGRKLDQIAEARGATVETVRSQLRSIFAKLEVSTQAQLVGRVAAVAKVLHSPGSR